MATTTLEQRTMTRPPVVLSEVRRPSPTRYWRPIARFVILATLAAFWVAPIVWMVLTSLKPEAQTATDPPTGSPTS